MHKFIFYQFTNSVDLKLFFFLRYTPNHRAPEHTRLELPWWVLNHIYGEGDPYFVLKDFSAYVEAQNKINTLYENRRGWLQMCLVNIAHSGKFSSDNSIRKYAEDIWHIKEVKRGE